MKSLDVDREVASFFSWIDECGRRHRIRECVLGEDDWATKRLALRWELAAFRLKAVLARCAVQEKAGFKPGQPRWRRGNGRISGRWSGGSGAGGSPGIGHNQGPPPEAPPEVPKQAPASAKLRNAFIKSAARWLLKATLRQAVGPIGTFAAALEAAVWLQGDRPRIDTYTEAPKTLDELKESVATPRWGYDIHHIAEQTSSIRDGFSPELVHGPDNLVRIPTLKHWEITGWYSRPNEKFDGLTPRQYLKGKSWAERTRIGQEILVDFGVLAP